MQARHGRLHVLRLADRARRAARRRAHLQRARRDTAGNTDATPATRTFTIDTTPPDTTIDRPRPRRPLALTSTEPGSTFECKLDAGDFEPCSSPHTLPALPDGTHTLEVRATDAAGNVDPTPATRTFTVDTVAPETTINTGPAALTRDATPSFTFSADEPGAEFECKLDTGAYEPCSSPRRLSALADGEHTFFVRAKDPAGNTDATPDTRTFTIDTTAPVVTLGQFPRPLGNDPNPRFTFGATETVTYVCTLESTGQPTVTGQCGPDEIVYTALVERFWTFTLQATDEAGNVTTVSKNFRVDLTAPITSFSEGPEGLTTDSSPTFAFAAAPPDATFACSLDGAPFAPCTTPTTLGPLADGRHTFTVRATDLAGNTDLAGATRTFTVDGPPPTSSSPAPRRSCTAARSRSRCARMRAAPRSSARSTALRTARARPCCARRRSPGGQHVYRVRATDGAGNVSAPAEFTFTVVNASPRAALTIDAETGAAPHTLHATVGGTDADGDRLAYALDFGDGSAATTGTLPAAAPLDHRYETPGTYTIRLTVADGRESASVEQAVTVTTVQQAPAPGQPLSLTLSAPSLDLGAFIPGLTRDYTAALTATTSGPAATLKVADASAAARGHLVSGDHSLSQPLRVLNLDGAFAPSTSAVTIPTRIEFRQSIDEAEALHPGVYAKPLTFTLAVSEP